MKGKTVITGAGGFIGGHLVKYLMNLGFTDIRAVDQKPLDDWYQLHANVENLVMDVQGIGACQFVCKEGVLSDPCMRNALLAWSKQSKAISPGSLFIRDRQDSCGPTSGTTSQRAGDRFARAVAMLH